MNPIQFKQYLSGRGVGTRMHSAVSIAFLSTIFAAAAATFSVSELSDLGGGNSSAALSVNDAGDIVGHSFNANLQSHSTVWPAGGKAQPLALLTTEVTESDATAISPAGVIVGTNTIQYALHATRWASYSAPAEELNGLGGWNTSATGVNSKGDAVGFGLVSDNSNTHGIRWLAGQKNGNELVPLAGGSYSQAFAINSAGDIVGVSDDASGVAQATIWAASNLSPSPLKGIGGAVSDGQALGINDNGDIVGYTRNSSRQMRPTLWKGPLHTAEDLGTLGGTYGIAYGVNPSGEIVGYSGNSLDVKHATLWSAGSGAVPSTCKSSGESRSRSERSERSDRSDRRRGSSARPMASVAAAPSGARVAMDLGTHPTGTTSQAFSINASGLIVGFGDNAAWQDRAMSWKSLGGSPPPPPVGTPGNGQHQGNHQNEGEEEGDC